MANSSADFRPDHENAVYIGAGASLKGEISVPDTIVVDGEIEGQVTARIVVVGHTGVIRGNIVATEADVSGWISDHIDIKQLLVVRATGRVEGRVTYGEIELEKGAVVTGDLSAAEDYRAAARTAPAGKGAEAPALLVASASVEESRGARNGAAKSPLYIASDAKAERRNILRAPIRRTAS
jgi:cytoskeletal protein CcmA (bactofilin family)